MKASFGVCSWAPLQNFKMEQKFTLKLQDAYMVRYQHKRLKATFLGSYKDPFIF